MLIINFEFISLGHLCICPKNQDFHYYFEFILSVNLGEIECVLVSSLNPKSSSLSCDLAVILLFFFSVLQIKINLSVLLITLTLFGIRSFWTLVDRNGVFFLKKWLFVANSLGIWCKKKILKNKILRQWALMEILQICCVLFLKNYISWRGKIKK